MRGRRWYGFVIIIGLFAATSCGDTPTCVDTATNLVKVNFINDEGEAAEVFLTSLKAIGNEDGFPEYANDTITDIILSLNPADTTTTFILEQTTGTDTLGLKYDVVAKLISPECGLDAAFDKLDTTFTTYDALSILNNSINEDVVVNIEITL
jgi:hypothetical protein